MMFGQTDSIFGVILNVIILALGSVLSSNHNHPNINTKYPNDGLEIVITTIFLSPHVFLFRVDTFGYIKI